MSTPPVFILDEDDAAGNWIRGQLGQIDVTARWMPSVADLLAEADDHAPVVCLFAVHPPASQALALIAQMTQEPRFAQTAFILMGPAQFKHAAFEAGADDYLTTPPDVIELRKRVRLYLKQAALETRIVAEESITQEMAAAGGATGEADAALPAGDADDPVTLLEHAARLTRERTLFETILRSAGEAIALIAPDGTLVYANPAWEQRIAPADSERLVWPPETGLPETNRAIRDAVEHRQPWRGELRTALPGRAPRTLATTITPAFDADGDLVGFVVLQAEPWRSEDDLPPISRTSKIP